MNQEHPSGPALDISTFSLPVAMDEIFGEGGPLRSGDRFRGR